MSSIVVLNRRVVVSIAVAFASFASVPLRAQSEGKRIPSTPGVTFPTFGPSAVAASDADVQPSLSRTFAGIPSDVWHSVSFDSARVAGVGLAAALLAHQWDRPALEEFQENATFRHAVKAGNTYGSLAVQGGGALGAYLVGHWSGNPHLAQFGLDVVRAQLVTQTWVQAVKVSVNRRRPDGTSFSFPSGHVASSFATATIVQREFGWKLGAPMYGLASYVAAARIAQNHHYLSDVAFGAALGIAGAHSLTLRSRDHTWRVSPSSLGGGVGVQVRRERRNASSSRVSRE